MIEPLTFLLIADAIDKLAEEIVSRLDVPKDRAHRPWESQGFWEAAAAVLRMSIAESVNETMMEPGEDKAVIEAMIQDHQKQLAWENKSLMAHRQELLKYQKQAKLFGQNSLDDFQTRRLHFDLPSSIVFETRKVMEIEAKIRLLQSMLTDELPF